MANQTEETAVTDAQVVGVSFIQQYYPTLHKSPEEVYKFYADSSILSRPGPGDVMTSATTVQGINDIILSLDYKNYYTEILTADSQFSHNDGVIVLVTGWLTGNNERKKFAQSFFLAPQSQDPSSKKYFVVNDVLRFVNDRAGNAANGSSQAPIATPVVELARAADDHVPSEATSVEVEVNPSNTENQVNQLVDIEKESIPENGVALENGHAEENGHAKENGHAANPVDSGKSVADVTGKSIADVNVIAEAPVSTIQEDAPKKSFASVVNALNKNATPFQMRAPLPKSAVQPRPHTPAVPKPEAPAPASPAPAPVNGAPGKNDDEAKPHAIFVANLPMSATVDELDKLFKQFGPIKHDGIQVRSNRQQGTCFGFVEFESASSKQSAIEASPIPFGARKLSIEERKTNNDKPKLSSGRSGYRNDNFRGGRGNYYGNRGHGRNELERRGEFSSRARGNGHAGHNGEVSQKATSNGVDKAGQEAPVKAA